MARAVTQWLITLVDSCGSWATHRGSRIVSCAAGGVSSCHSRSGARRCLPTSASLIVSTHIMIMMSMFVILGMAIACIINRHQIISFFRNLGQARTFSPHMNKGPIQWAIGRLGIQTGAPTKDQLLPSGVCPDLPAVIWQSIYSTIKTQRDVCSGMRVCKSIYSAIPELLQEAIVPEDSQHLLPAISKKYTNLRSLHISPTTKHQHSSDQNMSQGGWNWSIHFSNEVPLMSTLTFPELLSLKITAPSITQADLIAPNYPNLQSFEWSGNRNMSNIRLQLPFLQHIKLGGMALDHNELAAYLGAGNCPALQTVVLEEMNYLSIKFHWQEDGREGKPEPPLVLDLPSCTSLTLSDLSNVHSIKLFAPCLTELLLDNCDATFELLSCIRRPKVVEILRTASSTQAAATVKSKGSSKGSKKSGRKEAPKLETHVDTGALRRLAVTHSNMEWWEGLEDWEALVNDPRVVELQEKGNFADDSEDQDPKDDEGRDYDDDDNDGSDGSILPAWEHGYGMLGED